MTRNFSKHGFSILAALSAGLFVAPAQAGVFRDVAVGLGYAGFDIAGQRNVLSGGADFSISQTFAGNELDFGVWDLTLQGPVAFEISSGGRGLSELEISLSTAQVGGGTATPLSYFLNADVGGQETQISGQLLLDADISFNGFGFYDLTLDYSSRQNVSRDGRFANDDQTFDSDVGPINVSGNIFADALAAITQPIFDATGAVNPFASFSGRSKVMDALANASEALVDQLMAGKNPAAKDISFAMAAALGGQGNGSPPFGSLPPGQGGTNPGQGNGAPVPEPSVLFLMLLAAPFVIRGGIRHGTSPGRRQV